MKLYFLHWAALTHVGLTTSTIPFATAGNAPGRRGGGVSLAAPLASSLALLLSNLPMTPVRGYDLLVNASGGGDFYRNLYNGFGETKEVIGGMYQDPVFDSSGARVGTLQGYSYYLGTDWKEWNSNAWMFLDGGELILLGTRIIAGTGKYERYTGGKIVEINDAQALNHTAKIDLIEPDVQPADGDASSGDAVVTTFRITSAGGYYMAITDQNNSQIGEIFQNPMIDASDQVIGMHQGFAFNFPNNTSISDLGYSTGTELENSNRLFQMDDGEKINAINQAVVFGTGPYRKYEGSIFSEVNVSPDPNYVANITLVVNDDAASAVSGDVTLCVISKGGYYAAITDPETGDHIGARFQNPVFDSSTGERIGTNQGYGFYFPSNDFTREIAQGNRHFFLNEGTLNIYNDVVVGATGRYKQYTGGIIHETIHSQIPYNSSIHLVVPSIEDSSSTGEKAPTEVDGGSATSSS
ncbi:hypothetical protein ACHAW5_009052 [Stephanodiscus triporus]|uniref:Uncharacterized protein n=1 Tax=Stephanodiscus triporus TaxID=2934178 RepID=A0ABD3PBD0_9STRA